MEPKIDPQTLMNAPAPSQEAMNALGAGPVQPDVQSQNQNTAPGENTLANPNSPVASDTMMGSAMMRAAKGSPFLAKLVDGSNKASAASPAPNAPGSVFRSIVAGAMHGLSEIGSSLGDAAAVGTVPHGGGALTGVTRTLQARGQRLAEQDHNRLLTSEANMRMQHEQKLIHQLDESDRLGSIDVGNKAVTKLKAAARPGRTIASDLTSDELKQYLKDRKIDPTSETAFPTGSRQIGEKDGKPVYQTTYTALSLPEQVTFDLKKPEDKAALDYLNKWGKEGNPWKDGQTMSGQQFNFAMQQAADVEAATKARNRTLEDAEIADDEHTQKLEAVRFKASQDGVWQNALSNANNDPFKAMDAIQANPQLKTKYPNLRQDVRQAYGEKEFDKLDELRLKKAEAVSDDLTDLAKKLPTAHGEEAAGIAAGLQARLDDAKNPPSADQKSRIQTMLAQANKQTTASLDFAADKKLKETTAEEAASAGDLDQLHDMALKYEVEPTQLFSRMRGAAQRQKFFARMHRDDPSWSEAGYKARYKVAQDFTPEGKGGIQVQSLNTFTGHIGDANELISTLQNTKSPLLNKGLNALKEQLGNDKIGPYIGALAAARGEYINFLNNMHAKTKADEELGDKLVSENTFPGAAQAIMRQMAQTVAIRGRSLNDSYKATMKKDYPDMLSPESAQILKKFNIDYSRLGGVSGQTKTETQTQHAPAAIQRPPEFPSATATMDFKGKDGVVHTYWVDAAHRPLGLANLPKE